MTISDPFFAAVHRRHPDVDLVVLPPEAPRPEPAGPAPDDALLDGVLTAVTDRARLLAGFLGLDQPADDEPAASWHAGPTRGTVRARARVVGRSADGSPLLDALAQRLGEAGWRVRRPDGGLPRLHARFSSPGAATGPPPPDLEVTASWAAGPGTVVLTVASSPVDVGLDRARDLLRPGGS